jgi:hypothetical protein
LLPDATFAQRSGAPAYIEGRLNELRQQLANLSARIKQLEVRDQQLQQRLEGMRIDFKPASDSRKWPKGRGAVTAPSQAKALLEHLRRVPNPTPDKLLAEFRRRLVELGLAKGGKR